MSVIKTENLDVYALVDRDKFVISVLLDNKTIMTCEYPILDIAKDVVMSLANERGRISGADVEDAYETIEAFEIAADLINDNIDG